MPDFLFTQIAGENIRSGTDIVQTSGRDAIGQAPGRYVADALADAALFAAHPRFVARSSNGRHFRALPEGGRVPVELGGTKGDGATDDGPAIRAAYAYAAVIGARGVIFATERFRAERMPPADFPLGGNPPFQVLSAKGSLQDHGGAEFVRQLGGRGLFFHPLTAGGIVDLPLGADAVAGSREVQLQTGLGSQLVPGDTVLWQLGEFPYDPVETPNWDFARVEAVTGDLVRLDRPMPQSLTLASVTGPNKRLRKLTPLRDHTIANLVLSGVPGEDGISIHAGQRITLNRVGGRNIGAGLLVAQYCDGVTVTDCWQEGTVLTQGSFGAAFSFAECRNVLLMRPRATAVLSLVKLEAGAEATVIGGRFENTIVNAAGQSLGSQVAVVNCTGRSSVTLHDLTITGFGGYRLLEDSNGVPGYEGVGLFSGTLRLNHPSAPFSIPLGAITGTLDMTIGGTREIYNFERLRHWRRRFVLRDNQYRYAFGPAGLLVRARAYTSPGVTVGTGGQLNGLWLGRSGDNGFNLAAGSTQQLDPGKDVAIPCYAGLVAGTQWSLRNQPVGLLCTTAATAGLNAANEFVEFEGWFAEQADLDVVLPESSVRGAGAERDPFEALFPAYDLPAIAAGQVITIDLPIPDMVTTDLIDAVSFVGGFGGLQLRGAEALAGQARLTIANPGTAAIDRTPTDLTIAFFKPLVGT